MGVAYNNEFGDWLREIMAQHGITSTRAVRQRVKVSHTTIDDILHGSRPTVETVMKIAVGFHEDLKEALLLAGYDEMAEQVKTDSADTLQDLRQRYDTDALRETWKRRLQIGQRIAARMEALDMKQSDLGQLIGKSQPNISGYLDGRIALDAVELERIAKALRITVTELYGEEPLDEDADGSRPKLIALYNDLPPDARDDLVAMAEALWKRKRSQDPVHGRKAD